MRLTDLLKRPNDSRIGTAEYERLKREHGGCLHVVHVNEGAKVDVPEPIQKLRAYEEANDIEGPPYLLVVEYAAPPEDEAPAVRLTVPAMQPHEAVVQPESDDRPELDPEPKGEPESVSEAPESVTLDGVTYSSGEALAAHRRGEGVVYRRVWYPDRKAVNVAVVSGLDERAKREAYEALRKMRFLRSLN